MERPNVLFFHVLILLLTKPSFATLVDICVFGATGGGVVASIAAARTGASVVLLVPRIHVGGMVTGGLMHTDSANDSVIGGITREFFERTESQYPGRPIDADFPPGHSPPGWLFESHVAEKVMEEMMWEANVSVIRQVGGLASVELSGTTVVSITTVEAVVCEGKVFVDASYEGDLLAAAGASMTWGRESEEMYGEAGAGRQLGDKPGGATISPYWNDEATDREVIPHVSAATPAEVNGSDTWIQTYTFRLCMTDAPGHIPMARPSSYNSSEWELWRRLYNQTHPQTLAQAGLSCLGPIPNSYSGCAGSCRKCDMIGSTTDPSTDMVGASIRYPNGTLEERGQIWSAHVEYVRGLLWFWSSDPAVPQSVRAEIGGLGFCPDEYLYSEPPYWPHQLYIREARRLVGDWVFTEHEPPDSLLTRSIAVGSYSFDCHQVSRVIHYDGGKSKAWVVQEGRVNLPRKDSVVQPSYHIPYDALLPKIGELTNVLASVASSASHVRYNSLRMEPTYMVMGHAAGVAAALAAASGTSVQGVDVASLQDHLFKQRQIIWP